MKNWMRGSVARWCVYLMVLLSLSAGLAVGEYRGETRLAEAAARAEAQAVYEYELGLYTACRLFGEGMFLLPELIAIRDCNGFVETARERDLRNFLYWQTGLLPAD